MSGTETPKVTIPEMPVEKPVGNASGHRNAPGHEIASGHPNASGHNNASGHQRAGGN